MNRKVIKIVSVLLMLLMVIMSLSTVVLATNDYLDPKSFNTGEFASKDEKTANVFGSFISTIINIVQVVGMGVAIIMLVVLAIKYISAAPSEKAELKKSVTIYVVGAIVLFAATGILQIIKNFAGANINDQVKDSTTGYVIMIDDTYLG